MSNSSSIRVRFAPSPTGYLHIGGARTALYSYLFAKRHGGTFVLRVEDTDKERSTPEATQAILDGMKWLGLNWDEGPFFQSQRTEIYNQYLQKLIEKDQVYRCYCPPDELVKLRDALRKEGKTPKYDRAWADIGKSPTAPYVWRFRVPDGETTIHDLIRGDVTINHREIEDLVLARSDGSPTYNFVVVIDDADMKISHVIRGDDHLNNTPKQILLYQALEKEIPLFAHLPMILGTDKKRLSKRHGATSVQAYRELGFLPHALINFLARIGWSHKDQEIFSMEELIEKFDLEHVGTSAGVFNEEKLLWLNQHYIKTESAEVLLGEITRFIDVPDARKTGGTWKKVIDALRERAKTTKEMAELSRFYFLDEVSYDEKATQKFLTSSIAPAFEKLVTLFSQAKDMTEESTKPGFEKILEEDGLQMGKLAQPLRVALVGGTVSPGIFEVLQLLGKDRVVERVKAGLDLCRKN